MIRLYPNVKVKGQSFKGVKKHVVPNQSMTLQQILQRFIKHEALPIVKEGFYAEGQDLDLEKVVQEDVTVREEIYQEHKEKVKGMRAKADDESKTAMQKAQAKKKQEETDLFNKWSEQTKDPKDPPSPKA